MKRRKMAKRKIERRISEDTKLERRNIEIKK
jgi:hypothetical protein